MSSFVLWQQTVMMLDVEEKHTCAMMISLWCRMCTANAAGLMQHAYADQHEHCEDQQDGAIGALVQIS